jgi:23S rRNA (guanosine2251-2'-O)-methyltransferase
MSERRGTAGRRRKTTENAQTREREQDRTRAPAPAPAVGGKRPVLEALRAGRAREVLVAAGSRSTPGMRDVLDAAAEAGVKVSEAPRERLDSLAEEHRGVVARLKGPSPELGERDLAGWDFADDAIVVVLDGVTDPQNLGAAARAADAAGAAMLVTRTHRSAGVTPAAVRASAGALLGLPHARVANLPRALDRLKDAGFTVAGLDAEAPRDIYREPKPGGRLALVVGSEGSGMARLTREHCDLLISIPMRGRVASLNAAASLAAVLYGWALAGHGVEDHGVGSGQ